MVWTALFAAIIIMAFVPRILVGIVPYFVYVGIKKLLKRKKGSTCHESNKYHNSIVQENLDKLKRHGYEIIDSICAMLANGSTGDGKLPHEEVLVEHILRELAYPKDMKGMKVLVTAGPP